MYWPVQVPWKNEAHVLSSCPDVGRWGEGRGVLCLKRRIYKCCTSLRTWHDFFLRTWHDFFLWKSCTSKMHFHLGASLCTLKGGKLWCAKYLTLFRLCLVTISGRWIIETADFQCAWDGMANFAQFLEAACGLGCAHLDFSHSPHSVSCHLISRIISNRSAKLSVSQP